MEKIDKYNLIYNFKEFKEAMYRKWGNDEIVFLKNNYLLMNMKDISLRLNRTKTSVTSMLGVMGLNKMWSDDEDNILRNKYGKIPYDDYKNELRNRSYSSVLNRATTLKLKSDRIYINYKYNVDHNFFNRLNNLNCYWGGFIAADGYIRKGTYCVGIKLSNKDKNHLEVFKENIKTDSPIRPKVNKTKDGRTLHFSIIEIYSRDIVKNLFNNFQITPKKSLTIGFPKIDNFENKLSYIAGLIDGDGCIYKNNNYMRISLVGSFEILKWVKETLSNFLDISSNKICPSKNVFVLNITCSKADKLIDTIRNIKDIPILKRKWYKYGL